ncbi:MAG: hypothetical protein LBU45_02025, partial [Azoarcus sp.]|nr:hypothetical protein [Azoarcus sp.]
NAYFRRNAPPFFDWQPFWLKKTNWIPAFAGMTSLKIARRARVTRIPPNASPHKDGDAYSFLFRTAARFRGNDGGRIIPRYFD